MVAAPFAVDRMPPKAFSASLIRPGFRKLERPPDDYEGWIFEWLTLVARLDELAVDPDTSPTAKARALKDIGACYKEIERLQECIASREAMSMTDTSLKNLVVSNPVEARNMIADQIAKLTNALSMVDEMLEKRKALPPAVAETISEDSEDDDDDEFF